MISPRWQLAFCTLLAIGAPAPAQPPPDYDFQWRTVGSPGNRPANAQEAPFSPVLNLGAVDHEYRMSRTEVTVSQWYDFVRAYAPYWTGAPNDIHFTSLWIQWNGTGYAIAPGAANFPADMSWHVAARYCNWLQNGKASNREAFQSGAYDASTFVLHPDGSRDDQVTRSPGAQFWIPSLDEWAKAVYYDPNRYGPGVGGYWRYPGSSDSQLIPGLPSEGGQTSAGIEGLYGFPVGSYPGVQSPWGLLDASGGRDEWTEGISDLRPRRRFAHGSETGSFDWQLFDRIDFPIVAFPGEFGHGLRVASVVPAPPVPALGVVIGTLIHLRRRRRP